MENSRKFMLVSADTLSRMGNSQNISEEHATSLRKQMSDILHRDDLSDERKLARYQQYEDRYLMEKAAQRQPARIDIYSDETDDLKIPGKYLDVLNSSIKFAPKNTRVKARTLGEFLLNNPEIQWNHDGEIVVNGRTISDSNLALLIADAVQRKPSQFPMGSVEFSQVLRKARLPDIIQETRGLYRPGASPNVLRRAKETVYGPSPTPSTSRTPFATPSSIPPHLQAGPSHGRPTGAARFPDDHHDTPRRTPPTTLRRSGAQTRKRANLSFDRRLDRVIGNEETSDNERETDDDDDTTGTLSQGGQGIFGPKWETR